MSTPVAITAEELYALRAEDPRLTILDVRWRQDRPEGLVDYLGGHIPGAVFVDLDYELSAPDRPAEEGFHPLPDESSFQDALRRWGLTDDAPVVVYDDLKNLSSARAWWLLHHAGLEDVRVLDGSLRAWTAAGYPLETEMSFPEPSEITISFGHMPTVGAEELAAQSAAVNGQRAESPSGSDFSGGDLPAHAATTPILDARPTSRYNGEDDPLSARPGHIPGAISAPTTQNVDENGRLLPAEQLRERFAALGLHTDLNAGSQEGAPASIYCFSGVHSCHTVLAATAAGFSAALFPGGYGQWSADLNLPVATPAPTI